MSVVGKMFGGIFGGGNTPKPVSMAVPPAMGPKLDAGSLAARERQRQLAGMQGTILTEGMSEKGPNRSRKSLLGE